MIHFDWFMKNKWVMILFLLVDIKLMCNNQFWLDDKKILNDMRNMKMPNVLFKRNNLNVYNRDNPSLILYVYIFLNVKNR